MDKDIRNAIERATQRARKILEQDFTAQLEGDFDIHRTGTVASNAGAHLSAREAFQREQIVATIDHKRAAGMGAPEAVADYVRDAAFTALNRFVALKMLEARGLLQECITKGEQSSGYREFCGLAPGLPLLPDSAGYRLYIESLFDELSTEVKVLFDRRDPASVLWPKRATFEQLLDILNSAGLTGVWGEDETIGWVYQFFNGAEERKKMREESQAPRNSRELAVRNQFFTPRYVVQFLTDNTLGRIWYEMRGTNTALAERCEYMVRKPGEEFVPRPKKDPRDLRVLDPACGSGHFLLYAFDLLLTIYEEAYADPDSPTSEATGGTLAADYPSLNALRQAVPGLVLAHNLYGVDIDPRCAQIAQLALWMRAQRAYRDLGVDRADRVQIRRSNIVVAEPLVADDRTAADFVARLGDAELARVFTGLVDRLKLAGDLGLLLRIESLVADQTKHGQLDLFTPPEDRIRATLARFIAEEGELASTQRRLFADDAAQGIGLLAIAEKKFDTVLMNPPFGESTSASLSVIKSGFGETDLFCAFVRRALELAPKGIVGAITNSSFLRYTDFSEFRVWFGRETNLSVLADLGWGVLDAAVSTCMYSFRQVQTETGETLFLDAANEADRSVALGETVAAVRQGNPHPLVHRHSLSAFASLPGTPYCFWFSASMLAWIANANSLGNYWDEHGIGAGPHNFFFRLRWELHDGYSHETDAWPVLANGGSFSPFFRDNPLHIDWGQDGRKIKAHLSHIYPYLKGNVGIKIQRQNVYFRPGLTYGKRTSRFNAQVLPSGCIPSFEGIGAYPKDVESSWWLLAYMNSRLVAYFLNMTCGQHKNSIYIDRVPIPEFSPEQRDRLAVAARTLHELQREACSIKETSSEFRSPALVRASGSSLVRRMQQWRAEDRLLECRMWDAIAVIEHEVACAIGLGADLARFIDVDQGRDITSFPSKEHDMEESRVPLALPAGPYRPILCRGEKPDQTDLYRFANTVMASPRSAAEHLNSLQYYDEDELRLRVVELVSWVAGQVLRGTRSRSSVGEQAGIHVDDEGHEQDIARSVQDGFAKALADDTRAMHQEALDILGTSSLRAWLRRDYFRVHLDTYSVSRRKAPIYWQLATPSASYSVWLYLHAFTKDTLFRVQNDYVAPKLAHEERRLEVMERELREKATAADRKALAAQEAFVEELRTFVDEVKRVAPLWKPNLDDGVIINFAPLWRLVAQHKPWQKEVKSTWDALCGGKYDWAHLAMHLWPERVVPKCAADRSLAIAHGLEEVFWEQDADGKWTARKIPTRSIEELILERTSPAVKAALKGLREAPAAAGGSRGRGGRQRAAGAAEGGNR